MSVSHPPTRYCLACCGDRLATLLETATLFCFYEGHAGGLVELTRIERHAGLSLERELVAQRAMVLICGGLTRCAWRHLEQQGIRVIPWRAGSLAAVLAAIRTDSLDRLAAPGCGGHCCRGGAGGKHRVQ